MMLPDHEDRPVLVVALDSGSSARHLNRGARLLLDVDVEGPPVRRKDVEVSEEQLAAEPGGP